MNDANSEKIFHGFVSVVKTSGDERGKNLAIINEILDRIKGTSEPLSNSPMVKETVIGIDAPFVEQLRAIMDNLEADNKRLQKIISRLNELI